jgi:hypothetical protein
MRYDGYDSAVFQLRKEAMAIYRLVQEVQYDVKDLKRQTTRRVDVPDMNRQVWEGGAKTPKKAIAASKSARYERPLPPFYKGQQVIGSRTQFLLQVDISPTGTVLAERKWEDVRILPAEK